jgi:metal-responsive CopG/Arc/MetJ family transcriptional regulator
MRSRNVHIKLSHDLLELVDQAATDSFQSRSAFIRETLALRLNQQHVGKTHDIDQDIEEIIRQFAEQDSDTRS